MGEVEVKVCGLTRPEDAVMALKTGARFAGVNGYRASPRFVRSGSDEERAILEEIPPERRVWVCVEPEIDEVADAFRRGYAVAQVHFDPMGIWRPGLFSQRFGREKLWLAPRMANPPDFRIDWIGLADSFLIDGFATGAFGGTGKRVDGKAFADLLGKFPEESFMLAGGLSPENVSEAISASGASRIDVNSGVESAPGIKDSEKIRRLFDSL